MGHRSHAAYRYYHCNETGETSWTLADGVVESVHVAPVVSAPRTSRNSTKSQSEREAEFFRKQKAAKNQADRLAAQREADAVAAMDPEERARHEAERKEAKDHEVRKSRMLHEQVAKGGYGNKAAKSKLLAGRGRGGKR